MVLSEDNVKSFLDELLILTKKYGIEIGGCGCCQSPWLTPIRDSEDRIKHTPLKYTVKEMIVDDILYADDLTLVYE